jgi:Xaa-Pro aminopeptidase
LVLRGHIAIARAVFPDGTTGAQLDTLSRQYLWQRGLDFDHGTGHGVGSYLSVHEGPARISKLGTVPLKRGMILSNEPGYYKTGAYGIRIGTGRRQSRPKPAEGARALGFEPSPGRRSTPFDRPGLLGRRARWLDEYHARCAQT